MVGVVFSGGNVIENLDLIQVALLPCHLEQLGQAVQGGRGATSLQQNPKFKGFLDLFPSSSLPVPIDKERTLR